MNKLSLLLKGVAAPAATYVDDVFQTTTYTGNGTTVNVTTGIDSTANDALIWVKPRNSGSSNHLFDTIRGTNNELNSDKTDVATGLTSSLTTFSSTGFTLGSAAALNTNGSLGVSWTFREAPNFFDMRTVSHTTGTNTTVDLSTLGTVGMVAVKATTITSNWTVWHRGLTAGNNIFLNLTNTQTTSASLSVTGTTLTIASTASTATYVIYAWAHDTTTSGVIQCGSYTGNGSASGPSVSLGWEPQYLLIKRRDNLSDWSIFDNVRGIVHDGNDARLLANTAGLETLSIAHVAVNGNGFSLTSTSTETNASGGVYIYLAIRRSNKPPTSAASVFNAQVYTGTNTSPRALATTISPDMVWLRQRNGSGVGYEGFLVGTRVRSQALVKTEISFGAESINSTGLVQQTSGYGTPFSLTGTVYIGNSSGAGVTAANINANTTGNNHVALAFKRAYGFFDAQSYTGNGADRDLYHQLGVAPEMVIVRRLETGSNWIVWHSGLTSYAYQVNLDLAGGQSGPYSEYRALPTASQIFLSSGNLVNAAGSKYLALMFATRAGISKVGSYVGNGSTQNIDCGFSTGARFVLVKNRGTGNWCVFDSARGIGASTDPYLVLNSTSAEVTTADAVAAYSGGFAVNSANPPDINANGSTYIYLAIA